MGLLDVEGTCDSSWSGICSNGGTGGECRRLELPTWSRGWLDSPRPLGQTLPKYLLMNLTHSPHDYGYLSLHESFSFELVIYQLS